MTMQQREVYQRAHSMDKPAGGFLAPIRCGHARSLHPSLANSFPGLEFRPGVTASQNTKTASRMTED